MLAAPVGMRYARLLRPRAAGGQTHPDCSFFFFTYVSGSFHRSLSGSPFRLLFVSRACCAPPFPPQAVARGCTAAHRRRFPPPHHVQPRSVLVARFGGSSTVHPRGDARR